MSNRVLLVRHWTAILLVLAYALLPTNRAVGETKAVTPEVVLVTDGPIQSVMERDGLIFVRGAFTRIGPQTGGFIAVDAHTGEPAKPFPFVKGRVWAMVPDQQGRWYVGGRFGEVDGQSVSNLVRFNSDFTLDTAWRPEVGGSVFGLLLGEECLFVGGGFFNVNGNRRHLLAAVDLHGGELLSWNPNDSVPRSYPGMVTCLGRIGNTVYIGGAFDALSGTPRRSIAAVDGKTGRLLDWDPSPAFVDEAPPAPSFPFRREPHPPMSVGPRFSNLLVTRDHVILAGFSHSYRPGQGTPNNLVILDRVTAARLVVPPTNGCMVYDLALAGDQLYLGGSFAGDDPARRPWPNSLAAVDLSRRMLLPWSPPCATVHAISLFEEKLYAGSLMSSNWPLPMPRPSPTQRPPVWRPVPWTPPKTTGALRCFHRETGEPFPWSLDPDGGVMKLMAGPDWVFVAGQFMSVNSVARDGVAVLDAASGRILPTAIHAGLAEPSPINPTAGVGSKELGVGNVRIISRVAFIEVQASPRAFAEGTSVPTFTFPAQEDMYYDVEASTDLVHWELLGRWRAPFRVQDNAPAGSNYRFYRAWPSIPGPMQSPIPPGSTGGVMRPFSPPPAVR